MKAVLSRMNELFNRSIKGYSQNIDLNVYSKLLTSEYHKAYQFFHLDHNNCIFLLRIKSSEKNDKLQY